MDDPEPSDFYYQNVEAWERELIAAGWERMRLRNVWRSPDGSLYRGPYGAWKLMRTIVELNA